MHHERTALATSGGSRFHTPSRPIVSLLTFHLFLCSLGLVKQKVAHALTPLSGGREPQTPASSDLVLTRLVIKRHERAEFRPRRAAIPSLGMIRRAGEFTLRVGAAFESLYLLLPIHRLGPLRQLLKVRPGVLSHLADGLLRLGVTEDVLHPRVADGLTLQHLVQLLDVLHRFEAS